MGNQHRFSVAQLTVPMAPTHKGGSAVDSCGCQARRVVFENDKVRVLVVSYAPGEKTKMADHQNARQIALTERKERLTSNKGGIRDLVAKPGDFERGVNGQYMTENLSSQFSDVLVVELKTDPANAASAAFAG